MFAIAGVTGHTGRAAADALLSEGEKVRVVAREAAKGEPWRARGAEHVVFLSSIGAQHPAGITRPLARPVQPVLVPLDQIVPTFTGIGVSKSGADLLHEMYDAMGSGRLVYENRGAPDIRGTRRPADVLGPMPA